MEFRKEDLLVGGMVLAPHSSINDYAFGEIVETTSAGIHVIYFKGEATQQRGFYSWSYLKHKYGAPTLKLLPPHVTKTVTSKNRFEDDAFKADGLPWED